MLHKHLQLMPWSYCVTGGLLYKRLLCLRKCIHVADVDLGTSTSRTNLITVVALSVAAGVAALLLAAACLAIGLLRHRKNVATKCSRSTLLKLSASSGGDLKLELDKASNPILLGKGAFGEVRGASQDCSYRHGSTPQMACILCPFVQCSSSLTAAELLHTIAPIR